ncbi:unnamed protein product [Cylicocyclus nassatus]|uniref:Uncharacterized protein n=1 Tax=Cylicocyclus nassatus TaxID=53992 RepID=A0AA36H378_CYLNA|nr:unnamed protein product [Cylicocyclus nassatus]
MKAPIFQGSTEALPNDKSHRLRIRLELWVWSLPDMPITEEAHSLRNKAAARLLNLSNQSASLGVFETTVYTRISFHLTEVIKNITNLAFEGSHSLALVALQLRSIADVVGKCQFVRCEIVELVGRCIQIGICLSIIHSSATY